MRTVDFTMKSQQDKNNDFVRTIFTPEQMENEAGEFLDAMVRSGFTDAKKFAAHCDEETMNVCGVSGVGC